MRITPRCLVVLVVLVASIQSALQGQALADVAKAEEARRKTAKTPVKVYTNDDLGNVAAPAPAPDPTPAASVKESQKPAAVDETKTEKYWKARAAAIEQSLARNRVVVAALQSQVSGLNAESLNTEDPGQRGLLLQRIQTATSELGRVQQEIEAQTRAAADLREEARKANIPPGWLR
jgi:hypothetical protein